MEFIVNIYWHTHFTLFTLQEHTHTHMHAHKTKVMVPTTKEIDHDFEVLLITLSKLL